MIWDELNRKRLEGQPSRRVDEPTVCYLFLILKNGMIELNQIMSLIYNKNDLYVVNKQHYEF